VHLESKVFLPKKQGFPGKEFLEILFSLQSLTPSAELSGILLKIGEEKLNLFNLILNINGSVFLYRKNDLTSKKQNQI